MDGIHALGLGQLDDLADPQFPAWPEYSDGNFASIGHQNSLKLFHCVFPFRQEAPFPGGASLPRRIFPKCILQTMEPIISQAREKTQ